MHSPTLLDHFQNPRNSGELEPPSVAVQVENPVCGDILRLSARFEDGRLTAIRYKAKGCTASIAAGSALTELMLGKSREQLAELRAGHVETALGGLIPESKHVARLCMDAVAALLK